MQKLIGVTTGTYEGNNYAKVITVEPFDRAGSHGQNAIVSRADYGYITQKIVPDIDLYLGQEVALSYDRFGRVQEISLL